MKRALDYFQAKPGVWALVTALMLAVLFNLTATEWLNRSYAASAYPVPYYVAQLSFDASRLQGWYAYMLERGTLGIYWQTQFIDFVFILSTILLHFMALLLISRAFAAGSAGRRAMVVCAFVSALGPLFDVAENLVSFVMLAQPLSFPVWLAWLYSGCAALKFAFFCFAYLAASLGLIAALAQRLRRLAVA